MAVSSLWHRESKNGLGDQDIRDCIDYAINPDKTTLTYAQETIGSVFDYVNRDSATTYNDANIRLISGVNCNPFYAADEFVQVKKLYGKMNGYVVWHGYQSFKPSEIEPLEAHKLGVELANRMWGDKYQITVSTHLDKEHIHNHFVINSVSFVDGKKYDYSYSEIFRLRRTNDDICRENGLSVIEPKGKGENYRDWYENKYSSVRTTKRGMLKEDIDDAIAHSSSMRNFIQIMRSYGYDVRDDRKYLAFRYKYDDKGMVDNNSRFLRLKSLGTNYSEEEISLRILENRGIRLNQVRVPQKNDNVILHYYYRGNFNNLRKPNIVTNRILSYILYVPFLSTNKTQYPKRHYAARKDIMKLRKYQASAIFAEKNNLRTIDDLKNFRDDTKKRIQIISRERDANRIRMRKTSDYGVASKLQNQINEQNALLLSLREKVTMCETVLKNYDDVTSKLEGIQNDKKTLLQERKEKNEYRRTGSYINS